MCFALCSYEVLSTQSDVTDSQIDLNSMQKRYLLVRINTIIRFLLFRMKYTINGGCLFDD